MATEEVLPDGTSAEAWRAWLDQKVGEAPTAAAVYVLVDGRSWHGLEERLKKADGLDHASLWAGKSLAHLPHLSPWLIRLRPPAQVSMGQFAAELAEALRTHEDPYLATWMWSTWGIRELAAHLSRYTEYTLDDRRRFCLHLDDNRILHGLRAVWESEQCVEFLSPCVTVAYRLRNGRMAAWAKNENDVPADTVPPILSSSQHITLGESAYADRVAVMLRQTMPWILDGLEPSNVHDRILKELQDAERFGMGDDDRRAYVVLSLTWRKSIASDSAAFEILESCRKGVCSADEAFKALSILPLGDSK